MPDSVFSAWSGRSSEEACYTSALINEEVPSGATEILTFISLLLMWSSLVIRLIGRFWIGS